MPPFNSNHWTTNPEYIDFLNFLIAKTANIEAPMSIRRVIRDFKEKSGAAQGEESFVYRMNKLRTKIHTFAHIGTNTKVRLLFALSASVDANFLKNLRKNAFVQVDENNRIVYYKAINGSLKLRGVHSLTKKTKTAMLECKHSLLSLIINYFETKDDADAVPRNEEEKEWWNLIEYITEKCENVNCPLNICQLVRGFNKKFGMARSSLTIRYRLLSYCRDIQKVEFLDTHSKVKQLFGLSATVDSDYLEKLRKDASVDVDGMNRITNYKAKDGSFELRGDHSPTAKMRTAQYEYRKFIRSYYIKKNDANAIPRSKEEQEMWNLIEFINEKCENVDFPLNISQLTKDCKEHFGISRPWNCIYNRVKRYCRVIQNIEFMDTHSKVRQLFGLSATLNLELLEKLRKTAVVEVDHKNRIIKYMSNDNSLTLRGGHWGSKKTKARRVEEENKNATTISVISGAKIDHKELGDSSDEYSNEELDSEFDSDDENDPIAEKMRNGGTTGSSSSKQIGSSSNNSMRPDELNDAYTNYPIDDEVKLEPFRGLIQEDLNEFKEDEDIQQIQKPFQAHDEHDQIEEVPIKIEIEEPVEVKPETSHSSKLDFFVAIHSLILCLDTPSLFWIHSKIYLKIQNLKRSDEVVLNNEIVLILELLIDQLTNHSVVNLSETAESVNLSNFLCYLKAAILNSKMSGVDDLVENISKLIEESQTKRIPMEKMANALLVTLNIDSF